MTTAPVLLPGDPVSLPSSRLLGFLHLPGTLNQGLVDRVVLMLTRRTWATTEAWAPILGVLLAYVLDKVGVPGDSATQLVTVAAPILAGLVVSFVATIRKMAVAKALGAHLQVAGDAAGTALATLATLTPPPVGVPVVPVADVPVPPVAAA